MASFPQASVLDNFNRANEGPPPSANWTDKIVSSHANGLKVASNALACGASVPASSYWSAATFGPDIEVYATFVTVPTANLSQVSLWGRLAEPVTSTPDGYRVIATINTGSNDSLGLQIITDGIAGTLGGASISIGGDYAAGDSIGMKIVGPSLTAYYKPSAGSWTEILRATDATYSAAGYVGAQFSTDTSAVLDDLGAGTFLDNRRQSFPSVIGP